MFEPKIIAFLCSWCSYTGADTAGISRLKSPANLRAVRVPCSGRVSPEIIMRTFDQGADGVLVLGCHIGECHYDSGNHRAAKRLPILQSLMAFAGLEPERLRLDWVSASEGERFARIVTEFTQAVRALGPVQWNTTPAPAAAVENPWPALLADPSAVRRPKTDIYEQQLGAASHRSQLAGLRPGGRHRLSLACAAHRPGFHP
jgi:F420-non-reducing hydrogenase iron-sulfur subunit